MDEWHLNQERNSTTVMTDRLDYDQSRREFTGDAYRLGWPPDFRPAWVDVVSHRTHQSRRFSFVAVKMDESRRVTAYVFMCGEWSLCVYASARPRTPGCPEQPARQPEAT